MFAITGVTGKVGGQVAMNLLATQRSVRAVLRDPSKADAWRARGCEVAIASMEDAEALSSAFSGTEAVFVLLPPIFDPSPGFAETHANVQGLVAALQRAKPARVVAISTIGAQAGRENLLTQLQIMEQSFLGLDMPVAFLRPAWFMENNAWDIDAARTLGVVSSFLQPLDKPVPMVATADVAATAADLLVETWSGVRVVELEGPRRITPVELARDMAVELERDVVAQAVPRATWEALFRSQGMNNPGPRIKMLDGFNEGWIEFASPQESVRKGATSFATVLRGLCQPTKS